MFQLKAPFQDSDKILFVDTIFDPSDLVRQLVGMLNRKKPFYVVIGINKQEQLVRGVGDQFLKIAKAIETTLKDRVMPKPSIQIGYISHEEIPLMLVTIKPELKSLNDDAYYLKEDNPYGYSWVRYYKDIITGSTPVTRKNFREKQVEENYNHLIHCQRMSGAESDMIKHLIDSRELVGSLNGQVEDLLQFIKRNISYTTTWQYPIEVIRGMIEFIIITRDYRTALPTSIDIMSDSILISAPVKIVKKDERAQENYLLKEYLFDHNIHRYEKLSDVGYFLDNHEECSFSSFQKDGRLNLLLKSVIKKGDEKKESLSHFVDHLNHEEITKIEGNPLFHDGSGSLDGQTDKTADTDKSDSTISVSQEQVNVGKRSIKVMLSFLVEPRKAKEIMIELNLKDRETFYNNYLNPAQKAGWIEQTIPDKPKSPKQRYVITKLGSQQIDGLPF